VRGAWGGTLSDHLEQQMEQQKIYNKKYIVAFGGLWLKIITQQPTKNGRAWRKETVEKRDKCGGVAEGCQCTMSVCGRREGAMYRTVDDCTLLGHDAEHHDPNTAATASKIAGKLDLIYFNNNIEPRPKMINIINEIILYFVQEREVAPSGLALLLV
jgi:hypothetical protein